MAQKLPEKKMPSTAENATKRSAKEVEAKVIQLINQKHKLIQKIES